QLHPRVDLKLHNRKWTLCTDTVLCIKEPHHHGKRLTGSPSALLPCQRCVERLRNSRSRLLQRYRQVGGSLHCGAQGSFMVQEVMEEEWNALQTADRGLPSMWSKGGFGDIFNLKNDEELAVLEEIQRELVAQEQAILEEYDKSMQYEEQCVIAMAEGLDADNHVICPLCHRNNLTVNSHFVSCPCGMYINTLNKNITVEYLRSLLESRVTDHNYQCCQNPVFSVASGIERCANLLMSCMACDYLSVIL
ncbi:RPA-interacting protein A-like isoform X1, partial [Acipenser oxyrinchus oxyrinchus]